LIASWIAERLSPEAAFFVHDTLRKLHLTGVVVELAERPPELEHRVGVVEETQKRTEMRLQKVERGSNRRAGIPEKIRQLHVDCVREMFGGVCPCGCARPIGDRIHIDHFDRKKNAAEWFRTWAIREDCNLAREGRHRKPEDVRREQGYFDAYYSTLEEFIKRNPGRDPRAQGELF
jgi:hypothetical protein